MNTLETIEGEFDTSMGSFIRQCVAQYHSLKEYFGDNLAKSGVCADITMPDGNVYGVRIEVGLPEFYNNEDDDDN